MENYLRRNFKNFSAGNTTIRLFIHKESLKMLLSIETGGRGLPLIAEEEDIPAFFQVVGEAAAEWPEFERQWKEFQEAEKEASEEEAQIKNLEGKSNEKNE